MSTTVLGTSGLPQQAWGAFTHPPVISGHNPGQVTRLHVTGLPGRVGGDFGSGTPIGLLLSLTKLGAPRQVVPAVNLSWAERLGFRESFTTQLETDAGSVSFLVGISDSFTAGVVFANRSFAERLGHSESFALRKNTARSFAELTGSFESWSLFKAIPNSVAAQFAEGSGGLESFTAQKGSRGTWAERLGVEESWSLTINIIPSVTSRKRTWVVPRKKVWVVR